MSAWVKKQFRDAQHAQHALLSVALGVGFTGFAMVVIAAMTTL